MNKTMKGQTYLGFYNKVAFSFAFYYNLSSKFAKMEKFYKYLKPYTYEYPIEDRNIYHYSYINILRIKTTCNIACQIVSWVSVKPSIY